MPYGDQDLFSEFRDLLFVQCSSQVREGRVVTKQAEACDGTAPQVEIPCPQGLRQKGAAHSLRRSIAQVTKPNEGLTQHVAGRQTIVYDLCESLDGRAAHPPDEGRETAGEITLRSRLVVLPESFAKELGNHRSKGVGNGWVIGRRD